MATLCKQKTQVYPFVVLSRTRFIKFVLLIDNISFVYQLSDCLGQYEKKVTPLIRKDESKIIKFTSTQRYFRRSIKNDL